MVFVEVFVFANSFFLDSFEGADSEFLLTCQFEPASCTSNKECFQKYTPYVSARNTSHS